MSVSSPFLVHLCVLWHMPMKKGTPFWYYGDTYGLLFGALGKKKEKRKVSVVLGLLGFTRFY